MSTLTAVASLISGTLALVTLLSVLVKPIRQRIRLWLTKNEKLDDALLCMLRDRITTLYYEKFTYAELRRYEFESLVRLYAAYKALGGNSYVDKLYAEMIEWHVTEN